MDDPTRCTSINRLAELQQSITFKSEPPIQPIETDPMVSPQLKKHHSLFRRKSKASKVMPYEMLQDQEDSVDLLEMESFFQQTKAIRQKVLQLQRNNEEIEKSQREILVLVTEEEIEKWELVIEKLVTLTNKTALEIKTMLTEFEADNKRLERIAPHGSGDLRMRTLQHASLTRLLAKQMKSFKEIQEEFKQKKQNQLARQYLIIRPTASLDELDALNEAAGSMSLSSNQIFQLGGTNNPQAVLEGMRARRVSVMKIEKGITTLHRIFIEMQTMIDEQGELLDSIEGNVQGTLAYIDEANQTMEIAVDTQKNIRKLHCSIF